MFKKFSRTLLIPAALTIVSCVSILISSSIPVQATTEEVEVQITKVYNNPCPSNPTKTCVVADVIKDNQVTQGVVLRQGALADRTYEVYKPGDNIFVTQTSISGEKVYNYLRPKRNSPFIILIGLFLIIILFVGGAKGWRSLASLVLSTVFIFNVMLPAFVKYPDYVLLIGIAVAFFIYCLNQLIGHGFNIESYISILGGGVSFAIVLVISLVSARYFLISGFGNEGSLFIFQMLPANFRLGDLFIIGVLFGLTGAVDDVNATQTSSISELVKIDKDITPSALYTKGMRIGTSHMVSIINTLFLAYVGAALPTLILFALLNENFMNVIGREDITEEIVRTIVASIGLLLAIPLTTWLSVFFLSNKSKYSFWERFVPFSMTK